MNSKRSAKPRKPSSALPPTKQELYDEVQRTWRAYDQAAADYIASQTARRQLAVVITHRAYTAAEMAWNQWVFDNTP